MRPLNRSTCGGAACGVCRGCGIRRAWAVGKFANRRRAVPRGAWTPLEDALLVRLAGTVERCALAGLLEAEGYPRRSLGALSMRARKIGIALWLTGSYSQTQLAREFRTSEATLVRWAEAGWLRVYGRQAGRGQRGEWRVLEADVHAFIDRCGWAYDVGRMRPGPLRRRAEVAQQRDPWLTRAEAAHALGLSTWSVARWLHRGAIPHRVRWASGSHYCAVVRASDLPAARAAITRGLGVAANRRLRRAA